MEHATVSTSVYTAWNISLSVPHIIQRGTFHCQYLRLYRVEHATVQNDLTTTQHVDMDCIKTALMVGSCENNVHVWRGLF